MDKYCSRCKAFTKHKLNLTRRIDRLEGDKFDVVLDCMDCRRSAKFTVNRRQMSELLPTARQALQQPP